MSARVRLLASALVVVALGSGCLRMHARVPGALRGDLDDEQVIVRDSVDIQETRLYLFWGLLPVGEGDGLVAAARNEAFAAGGDGLANLVFESHFTPGDVALQILTLGVVMPRTYRLRADVVRIEAEPLPGRRAPFESRGGS